MILPHHKDQEAGPAVSTTTGEKCVITWGQHLEYCKIIACSVSSNTQKVMLASGTLQSQAYLAAFDLVCKQIASNEVTILHVVMD